MPQQKSSSITTLQKKAADHMQKARELQSKIKELEDERYLKIGKLAVGYHKKDWLGFELASFRKAVSSILEL